MENSLLTTSVLKADKKQAIALAKTFDNTINKAGKKIFRVTIEPALIEVFAPYKENGEWKRNTETGKLERKLIFRWTESKIGQKIEWDPAAVTI